MADTNETVAEIIAGMRREADADICLGHGIEGILKRNLADKLDAAHKREVQDALDTGGFVGAMLQKKATTEKSSAVGNAAKLREALENLYDQICYGETEQHVAANRQMIRDALFAPPRNCDKYATADEALKAQEQMFNDSNFANGECKLGCPECDNPRVGCKIAWLYAPATEKEGGNDGR